MGTTFCLAQFADSIPQCSLCLATHCVCCHLHPNSLFLFLQGSQNPGGSGLQAHRKALAGEQGQAANSELDRVGVCWLVWVFITGGFAAFCALQLSCCSVVSLLESLVVGVLGTSDCLLCIPRIQSRHGRNVCAFPSSE